MTRKYNQINLFSEIPEQPEIPKQVSALLRGASVDYCALPGGAIISGDARTVLARLPDKSVDCCVTSPPYWGLRDYESPQQIGLEPRPCAYVGELLKVFKQVWRILKDRGTLWLNVGDTYCGYHGNKKTGHGKRSPSDMPGYRENMRISTVGIDGLKNKDLAGIPWRLAFALQDAGWHLRSDIIWHKPNPKPESVKDRPTRAHEYIFLLTKFSRYYYDQDAVREPAKTSCQSAAQRHKNRTANGMPQCGIHKMFPEMHADSPSDGKKNLRTVWSMQPAKGGKKHYATFPTNLVRPCILAGCPEGGIVLDPFFGAGTVGLTCNEEGRAFVGVEVNPEYIQLAEERLRLGQLA